MRYQIKQFNKVEEIFTEVRVMNFNLDYFT